MVKYLSIGLGGFFGAIARVLLKSVVIVADIGQFPLNTFLINIA
jgi:fluoride ion exporter CrcB/FEX